MDHRQAIDQLEDALIGTREGALGLELRRHLEVCPDCRELERSYRLFAEALESTETAHPSSEVLARRALEPAAPGAPGPDAVGEHLAGCPQCRQELALTAAALAAGRREGQSWRAAARAGSSVRWAVAAVLALAMALGFYFRAPRAAGPVDDLVLSDQSLSGTRVVDGARSITATSVLIADGSDIALAAGETVVLGDGFSVGKNVDFRVEITQIE